MMDITAAQVKELREKTGLGMMICKQALAETKGDMATAIENLRKQGQMTAAKRAGKTAKEGIVSIVSDATTVILFEVNSETDFVARNDDFIDFVNNLGTLLLEKKVASIEEAKALSSPALGGTVVNRVTELIGKIGENIAFRRYRKLDVDQAGECVATYMHGKNKIGVVVKMHVDNEQARTSEAVAALGKDLAMQVCAANPIAPNRDSIPAETVAKEKEIYFTQAQSSGKPEKIWEKIVDGKLAKFYQEVTLTEQAFIKDPDIRVNDRIKQTEKETGATISVVSFIRMELGAEE
ncbi:MAG: elongation factor Ts [Chitinispirillaceae bacterium]|nr:elongation factor Ts [Chitinispirillaceae bacterium]